MQLEQLEHQAEVEVVEEEHLADRKIPSMEAEVVEEVEGELRKEDLSLS